MASLFSIIIAGEIPCYKIAENDNFIAFLDIFPLKNGHTLVVPKKEVDQLFDLDNETYLGLHLFAKDIAIAIKKAFPCNRVGVAVIGLEIPHAHIHLIPINSENDMNFKNEKLKLSNEEFSQIAYQIASQLS